MVSRANGAARGPLALMRRIVPRPLRQLLRRLHRKTVFSRAMRRLLADPRRAIADDAVLDDLVYGWGNEQWSALPEYLRYMATVSGSSPGRNVLECGSGLSTVLLAAVASKSGGHVTALEDSPPWGERVRQTLAGYGLSGHATVRVAPLRSFGEYSWYERPPADRVYDCVICDGPPGTTRGGRYGLLPVAGALLRPGCTILLDDAARPEEQAAIERWQRESGAALRVHRTQKPFAELTLP
jgi:predicted O-methyltransferase YrrM